MMNYDDPGFPIALLAILAGLRIAVYAAERFTNRTPATTTLALAPDETASSETPVLTDAPAAMDAPEPITESEPGVDAETDADAAQPETEPAPTTPETPNRFWAELLDSGIIAVVLVFFLIRPFVLQAFFIPSESMVPTLQKGDRLLALKYPYHIREPRHHEIVVFEPPDIALEMQYKTPDPRHPVDYVKRVVGIPGDRIHIVDGDGVYVNDVRQREPYISAPPNYDFPLDRNGEIASNEPKVYDQIRANLRGKDLVVPPGYLFVLGDNRIDSHDGHKWGLLSRKRLVGEAVFIFWPLNRFGLLK